MTANSSRKRSSRKTAKTKRQYFVPPKPYVGFPLTPHSTGTWMKKINGKLYYFGSWAKRVDGKLVRLDEDGWREALALYESQRDALHSGRTPSVTSDEKKVLGEICNRFLAAKKQLINVGELSPRSYKEYKQATDLLIGTKKPKGCFSESKPAEELTAADFRLLKAKLPKTWGPARRGKFIQLFRTIFTFAFEDGLIKQPMSFGSDFKKPGKAVLRKHKAQSGKKLFTAQEIRDLLNVELSRASSQMRAMILLGINAGLGNTDIGNLERGNLDLKSGWLDYPRIKTGLPRRAPLWKETLDALKAAIAERPTPKEDADADCIFLNRGRRRLVQSTNTSHSNYVSTGFRKLLRDMKINGRKGLNFYSLRHTFATIGLQTGDRDAVKTLMGHASHDMLSVYDETGPSDERLQAVTAHVHSWLFGEGGAK